ncbi:hypothetical protein MY11210_005550 [Beauveria gryllotalpidicola]
MKPTSRSCWRSSTHSARVEKYSRGGGYLVPEEHLRNAKIGGIGFPDLHVLARLDGSIRVPCLPTIVSQLVRDRSIGSSQQVAGTFLSASLIPEFLAIVNYIVQSYGQYSASIIAVNTCAQSLGSAVAPLFTTAMFLAMGVGGGGSLVAGVAALLSVCPFVSRDI